MQDAIAFQEADVTRPKSRHFVVSGPGLLATGFLCLVLVNSTAPVSALESPVVHGSALRTVS